ncbi:tetraacyldisaccharide 4'-kinase [Desulfopila aestuarii]|uniref:Tetraacyldisaccharide 4'-kinase n=1 Tax=Desulfopila aestuarii DSM 18488 TaxID=1121416 RepID=A0A1M7YKP2_9BACT|nr:tetraacyldisaccharide 4'-kinase [Desulfopila aestuarii]SHO53164.1 lipid-A-disaccharide kinase [Desulfopila aestuarii DSM 18488]
MNVLHTLYMLGRPIGPIYGKIMQMREWLYEKNIIKSYRLPVPVISVGNLTMGGTGKTPTVQLLADFLLEKGYRPAVVSRGYGGSATEPVNLVANGHEILLGPTEAGDEPYMLAVSVPGLCVLTGTKRILPCRYACQELDCDIILLDDGFQHLAVKRDLNIVLFNATAPDGNGRIFPGGELREPFSALARADALLFTGRTAENQARVESFAKTVQKHCEHVPTFFSENRIHGVFATDGTLLPQPNPHALFHAFSGIAHPERFAASLQQQGIEITGHDRLKDHAVYTQELIKTLTIKARESGATALITTQKDWVKLQSFTFSFPLYYLAIKAQTAPEFFSFILDRISLAQQKNN